MNKKLIYMVTSSELKIAQYTEYMAESGFELVAIPMELEEIQSISTMSVTDYKVSIALGRTEHRPILIDDTGLEIPSLNGFPGALLKPILNHGGLSLLNELTFSGQKERKIQASLITTVALSDGCRVYRSTGLLPGVLDFSDPSKMSGHVTSTIFYPFGGNLSLDQQFKENGSSAFLHRKTAIENLFCTIMKDGRYE